MILRKIKMHLRVVIFALSFLTTLAFPLHSDTREATWPDSKANQAHDKTDLTKYVDKIYKSNIDSSSLYSQENDDNQNLMAEEMQRKLNMESERLRIRLRQELAELREKLSPSPAHLSSTLASMRERLTPLTQQLQSSLSSNTQDLCSQLSLYLQGLETAETQVDASLTLYQEAFHWMSQTLEHSRLQVANIISDFHSSASTAIERLKEISAGEEEEAGKSKVWQEMSSRLGQEVSSVREEAQNRVGALKAQFAALQESAQPCRTEVAGSVEQFCQNAALQSQMLPARMERLFTGLEEELEIHRTSSLPLTSSTSLQEGGFLQEDFSVKLSALIQDILHSMQ
uniref:Zgc:162608 n=1 Tax=Acanthochromis polyacanthus TaxID=80966 RepID=A0A3Q1G0V4_9TELE